MKHNISNGKIAWMLQRIGDLLEIEGENTYKISAYRKAAQIVEKMEVPITEIKNLETIEGIGKATAAVIREIIITGRTSYLEELQQKIPTDLLTLLRIPGLGPKSVGRLYRELGIDTLEKLDEAGKKQRIRALSGYGAKKELQILKGLKMLKEKPDRIPIALSYPIAQEILSRVGSIPGVEQADITGSLRRFCETVKDLDYVIVTREPHPVAERLADLPDVSEVIAKGDSMVSVKMEYIWPILVDFHITPPETYASAMLHFTGSKDHLVGLAQRANNLGLEISHQGINRSEENQEGKENFPSEVELYQRLSLPYIPPEIREGRGEINRAVQTGIPRLVQLADIQGDLHMHTNWSDGGNTIEEMARACYRRNYRYMAITDHSRSLKIAGGLSIEKLLKQIEEIKAIEKKLRKEWGDDQFTILCGVEMDILSDGKLDYPDEVIQELDIVIGSIHSAFNQDEGRLTKRIIGAIENNHVDIIAHPTGRLIGRRDPYPVNIDAILKAAKETGTAIELNSNPNRLDLKAEYLQKAVEEYGIYISINTDAHSIMELYNIEVGVGTARRGWVEPEFVINTWPIDKLLTYLKRND